MPTWINRSKGRFDPTQEYTRSNLLFEDCPAISQAEADYLLASLPRQVGYVDKVEHNSETSSLVVSFRVVSDQLDEAAKAIRLAVEQVVVSWATGVLL